MFSVLLSESSLTTQLYQESAVKNGAEAWAGVQGGGAGAGEGVREWGAAPTRG